MLPVLSAILLLLFERCKLSPSDDDDLALQKPILTTAIKSTACTLRNFSPPSVLENEKVLQTKKGRPLSAPKVLKLKILTGNNFFFLNQIQETKFIYGHTK